MAGRLWIDEETAERGVLARIADKLALPRAGRDGRPEAGDAVIVFRRERREQMELDCADELYAPGVWLMDGRPGLGLDDIRRMRQAGVRVDPDWFDEGPGAGGTDGRGRHAEGTGDDRPVGGRWSGGRAYGGRLSGGRVFGEQSIGGRLSGGWMNGERRIGDRLSGGWVNGERRIGDRLTGGWVNGEQLNGNRLSGGRLSGARLRGLRIFTGHLFGGQHSGGQSSCERLSGERLFGKQSSGERFESMRLFEVPVFHLRPLTVRRVGRGSGLLPADWDGPHPLRRRLESAAVKALYAAGRDFGTVLLAASDDGAVRIAGPFGEPAERDLPLWTEAIGRFREELAEEAETGRRRELLIGADPEFLLVGPDGRVVSASRYFPREGAAGSDALRVRGQLRCPVAEFRPGPAPDPDSLMRGIRGLMRRAETLAAADGRPLRWLAGGMPVPGFALGGHLHLNVPPSARLLRVLDSCVALPLAAAEDARALRRRPRYGALGDFRAKSYGFEYRTPPSWLVSPLAAQAAFAVALLAARHTADLAMLTGLPSETEAGRRAYYEGDRELLRALARRVHDAMRRVPGYAQYRRWIAPFFAALERGSVWREDADIRPKWGLRVREGNNGGDPHVDDGDANAI